MYNGLQNAFIFRIRNEVKWSKCLGYNTTRMINLYASFIYIEINNPLCIRIRPHLSQQAVDVDFLQEIAYYGYNNHLNGIIQFCGVGFVHFDVIYDEQYSILRQRLTKGKRG